MGRKVNLKGIPLKSPIRLVGGKIVGMVFVNLYLSIFIDKYRYR